MAAGQITIDLLMRTGAFETDTARAAQSLKKLQKEAEAIGKAFGLAIVGAAGTLAYLVKSTLDANDHLQKLAQKTGIAADTLGGIGYAAQLAGGDLDSAGAAAGKLNKSLAEAAAGTKLAQEAFDAMGISVKDAAGNTKTADVALAEIADKFAGYSDGPEKAALALRIFGKAGADMIPLLNGGGDALRQQIDDFKKYSGFTEESAQQAEVFNDTVSRLKLLLGAFTQDVTAALLPALQALADLFVRNREEAEGYSGIAEKLAGVFKALSIAIAFVGTTFSGVADEAAAFFKEIKALSTLDFHAFAVISADAADQLRKTKKDFLAFYDAVYAGRQKALGSPVTPVTPGGAAKPNAPRLPGVPGTAVQDTAGAELKKRLDGQIKIIQDFGRQQGEAYQFAGQYLDGVYADGLVSQQAYFDKQKSLREANLQAQLSAFDKEIAAERDFVANKAAKPADRVAAEEKIALAVQQRADAVTKASAAEILADQASAKAASDLADAYDRLKATVLSLQGNDLGAAQIDIAKQFRDAQKLVTQAGGDPAVADEYKRQLEVQAQLTDAQKQYGRLLTNTGRIEENITLDAQIAGKTETETLGEISVARKKAIGELQAMAAAARDFANANPGNVDAANFADNLAISLKKARTELDPLAKQFNGIFEDSFANAFGSFVDGTKSAKDAFKDFANAVLKDISRIVAQNFAKALFGGDAGQGGIGAILSGIFGGGGGGSTFDFSKLAGIFGGSHASGGSPPVGKVSLVGERGPELFVPHTSGTIIPARQTAAMLSSGISVVNQFSIAGSIDRRSEQQIASAAGQGVRRAVSRIG